MAAFVPAPFIVRVSETSLNGGQRRDANETRARKSNSRAQRTRNGNNGGGVGGGGGGSGNARYRRRCVEKGG